MCAWALSVTMIVGSHLKNIRILPEAIPVPWWGEGGDKSTCAMNISIDSIDLRCTCNVQFWSLVIRILLAH